MNSIFVIISFLLVLLFGLFWLARIYWFKGRDWWRNPLTKHIEIKPLLDTDTIVAEHEPPDGLSPSEIGLLVEGKTDGFDVVATLLDLVNQGYIKINKTEEQTGDFSYAIERTEKDTDYNNCRTYERLLMWSLFENSKMRKVPLSLLSSKTTFSAGGRNLMDQVYYEMEKKNIFQHNVVWYRVKYICIGLALFSLGFFLFFSSFTSFFQLIRLIGDDLSGMFFALIFIPPTILVSARSKEVSPIILGLSFFSLTFYSLSLLVATLPPPLSANNVIQNIMLGSGVALALLGLFLCVLAAKFIDSRTSYGHELYRRALGFKKYLVTVEKNRQHFFDKEGSADFLLPYAISFQLTDKFVNWLTTAEVRGHFTPQELAEIQRGCLTK